MPDTKSTSDPTALKLTGDQSATGHKQFETATIDKPDSQAFGLTLNCSFADDTGKFALAVRQLDWARYGIPEDWQYCTMIRTEGSVLTNRAILSSGHTNGVLGDGYDIIPPGQSFAKPFMIGAWGDVNGPCFYSQTSSAIGAMHLLCINNQGLYAFNIGHNGELLWGKTTLSAAVGSDGYPVWDVGLTRNAAGRIDVIGSNGQVGELRSPRYSVKPASLDDYAIIIYDSGLEYQGLINGRGQWIQHHPGTPGLVIVGASGSATNFLETRPFGSSAPVAYISPLGEIGTTGTSGGVKLHDRGDNSKYFEYYASAGRLNVFHSVGGTLWTLTATGGLTASGNITATGSLTATGPISQVAVNRRDNNAQAAGIYSPSGGFNVFLNAIGSDVLAIGTDGKTMIGAGSTPLKKLLSVTATLDFGSTAAQTSTDLTVSVTGAAVGDSVSLGLPAAPPANTCFTGWVSAANTVTVRLDNFSAGAVDPPSGLYRVTIHSF
jgi:hypothetical protein